MIAIACDHAALELKRAVLEALAARGLAVLDMGSVEKTKIEYPEGAHAVARAVAEGRCALGILLCGTGIGMSMAANKIPGARAAVCTDAYTAAMTRAHNNANILCMGQRVVGAGVALSILDAFLDTPFEGGRHEARVNRLEG